MALAVTRQRQPGAVLHTHDFTELVLALSGTARHIMDGEAHQLTAGDAFVIHDGGRHAYDEAEGMTIVNVMFDLNELGVSMADLRDAPGYDVMFELEPRLRRTSQFAGRLHLCLEDLAHAETLVGRIERELKRKAPAYRFAATALLMELIAFLTRCYVNNPTPETRALLRISPVLQLLESDYAEGASLATLAEKASMSESTLLRVFRDALGTTPIDYLIRVRVRKAAELLRTRDVTVTEAAAMVGFNDSNYFSRQFRKINGIAPTTYRRHARESLGQ